MNKYSITFAIFCWLGANHRLHLHSKRDDYTGMWVAEVEIMVAILMSVCHRLQPSFVWNPVIFPLNHTVTIRDAWHPVLLLPNVCTTIKGPFSKHRDLGSRVLTNWWMDTSLLYLLGKNNSSLLKIECCFGTILCKTWACGLPIKDSCLFILEDVSYSDKFQVIYKGIRSCAVFCLFCLCG